MTEKKEKKGMGTTAKVALVATSLVAAGSLATLLCKHFTGQYPWELLTQGMTPKPKPLTPEQIEARERAREKQERERKQREKDAEDAQKYREIQGMSKYTVGGY